MSRRASTFLTKSWLKNNFVCFVSILDPVTEELTFFLNIGNPTDQKVFFKVLSGPSVKCIRKTRECGLVEPGGVELLGSKNSSRSRWATFWSFQLIRSYFQGGNLGSLPFVWLRLRDHAFASRWPVVGGKWAELSGDGNQRASRDRRPYRRRMRNRPTELTTRTNVYLLGWLQIKLLVELEKARGQTNQNWCLFFSFDRSVIWIAITFAILHVVIPENLHLVKSVSVTVFPKKYKKKSKPLQEAASRMVNFLPMEPVAGMQIAGKL